MEKPLTIAIIILGILFSPKIKGQETRKIDSLIQVVETANEDTVRTQALGYLAWEYMYSNPDTAFILAGREFKMGALLVEKGNTYLGKKQMAHACITQGVTFYLTGSYPKALEHYHKALKLVKDIGIKKGMAVINNNIGGIYYEQGDWDTALKYQLKGLALQEEILEEHPSNDNKGIMAKAYNNMGVLYHERGDLETDSTYRNSYYDEAIKYYLEALQFQKLIGNENTLGSTYSNLGLLYEETEKYQEALLFFEKAIAKSLGVGNKEGSAFSNIRLGSLHTKLKDYNKSAKHLNRGLKLATEYGSLPLMRSAYFDLHMLYEGLKDFKQSLQYYKLYTQAKDSLFNEQKSKEIGKIEATHEFEIVEAERERVEAALAKEQHDKKLRRDNLQYSGILIFMVLLFTGVFMLGRVSIPIKLAEGMIFFSFLLFFEFTLVLLDPYIEKFSSGAPAIKLMFNAFLAGLIFPLHAFFETKLKSRLVK